MDEFEWHQMIMMDNLKHAMPQSCQIIKQIYLDLIEYDNYLNWEHPSSRCYITIVNEDKRIEREKCIDSLGEPAKTLFKHACPKKNCDIPSYDELQIQECQDLRRKDNEKNNDEYLKACKGDVCGKVQVQSEETKKLHQLEVDGFCQKNSIERYKRQHCRLSERLDNE
jgi:hypothetical protein